MNTDDKVRVKKTVEQPTHNWGAKGVNHNSVGVICKFNTYSGGFRVNFPDG